MNIRQRNLQILATEIYKVKNDIAPYMKCIFQFVGKPYNLRNNSTLKKKMQSFLILQRSGN